MQFYRFPLSGHSHRVELFLSLLGITPEVVDVDLRKGEHKRDDFLALNALGQVPVLRDGDVVVADSNAILVYLARKFQRSDWLPDTPEAAAKIQRWLSIAAGQIAAGPAAARLITVFGAKLNPQDVIARAHAILGVINHELDGVDFLLGDTPTIADIALYTYVAHAPEGNVALDGYGHILNWLERIEALPGFTPMQSTSVGLVP